MTARNPLLRHAGGAASLVSPDEAPKMLRILSDAMAV